MSYNGGGGGGYGPNSGSGIGTGPSPSPKNQPPHRARLQFLLEDNNSSSPSHSARSNRLPDRGRARDAGRALSADAALGAPGNAHAPAMLPPPPRSLDWIPRVHAQRQHSADSLSSNGSIDIAAAAHAAAYRDDSSESGSASGCSPRVRPLPAPALLPAAHLLQSSGIMSSFTATGGVQQQQQQAPILAPALAPHVPLAPGPPTAGGSAGAGTVPAPSPAGNPNAGNAHPHAHAPARGHAHPHPHAVVVAAATVAGGGGGGGPSSGRARGQPKTEQQMRERHDQRKMKNRISAAASRDRKKRTFNNMMRQVQEAEMRFAGQKRIIETLTHQLDEARSRLNACESTPSIKLPDDLRHLVAGAELVSVQQIVELLRRAERRL